MRMIIARHAETIYNANARMQGQMAHTPLTRTGIAQAEAMGAALAGLLGRTPDFDIWASPAGRTLQTVSIVAEHLGHDYFDIRTDPRLLEIDVGSWEGRRYADIVAEHGEIFCGERRIFTRIAEDGEWYPAIAERLRGWLDDLAPTRDVLVISHGITLRVLRGLLGGGTAFEGVTIAEDAAQGTVFEIVEGVQSVLHHGAGHAAVRAV